jgi:hypothetical protein
MKEAASVGGLFGFYVSGWREYTFSFPRHDLPEVCHLVVPLLRERAQGKPGADCARSPVCERKHTGWNYRFSRDIPAFPAQWCYGFLRALPGEAAFLAPVAGGKTPASVAPGSRRQDHTTSPSAAGVFVRATCIALTPAASIASRAQRFVTIAKRPSGGLGVAATYFRFTEVSSNISDLRNLPHADDADAFEIAGEFRLPAP